MADEPGTVEIGVATVTGQDGDRVLVSLPMAGFPSGFQLRPGERVVLASDKSGVAVRPLVRTRVVNEGEVSTAGAHALMMAGEARALQDATVRSEGPASEQSPSGTYEVFEIDPGSRGGAPQVAAVRTRR